MDGRNDNSNHKSGKKKGDKKESPLRGAVVGYLSALVGFAQHLPHMVDFDMLRRLADVTGHADIAPLDLARALFSLVSKCRSANLRQRACVLLLEWERDGRCKLAALQHMYSAVDVSPREALHHVQSFVALFHYNEGSSDDLIAPLETGVFCARAVCERRRLGAHRSVCFSRQWREWTPRRRASWRAASAAFGCRTRAPQWRRSCARRTPRRRTASTARLATAALAPSSSVRVCAADCAVRTPISQTATPRSAHAERRCAGRD